ncbi:hypothetical protein LAZ40_11790 [Cereibacter sphaeroides]|uniref:hypothetical protein n=1 Tax=Cereibacter sphaeroides TaxID=1063 RepID=UPI001F2E0055|nr:hypothetical protein [Cereibacter sphaeroides]MCE6959701.1 hypothetical protein [Cereibacter sphaeroides]MCE6974438.1 hypothetical protein [Cereibacter sphaeroides]
MTTPSLQVSGTRPLSQDLLALLTEGLELDNSVLLVEIFRPLGTEPARPTLKPTADPVSLETVGTLTGRYQVHVFNTPVNARLTAQAFLAAGMATSAETGTTAFGAGFVLLALPDDGESTPFALAVVDHRDAIFARRHRIEVSTNLPRSRISSIRAASLRSDLSTDIERGEAIARMVAHALPGGVALRACQRALNLLPAAEIPTGTMSVEAVKDRMEDLADELGIDVRFAPDATLHRMLRDRVIAGETDPDAIMDAVARAQVELGLAA